MDDPIYNHLNAIDVLHSLDITSPSKELVELAAKILTVCKEKAKANQQPELQSTPNHYELVSTVLKEINLPKNFAAFDLLRTTPTLHKLIYTDNVLEQSSHIVLLLAETIIEITLKMQKLAVT